MIPSFPRIVPPRASPWRNPRKRRDQMLPSGNLDESKSLRRSSNTDKNVVSLRSRGIYKIFMSRPPIGLSVARYSVGRNPIQLSDQIPFHGPSSFCVENIALPRITKLSTFLRIHTSFTCILHNSLLLPLYLNWHPFERRQDS